jgi:hypothetical protein
MKTTITNVHVDSVSYDFTRAALCWEVGEFRYHRWIDISNPTPLNYDGKVFKNPKTPAERHYGSRSQTIIMNGTSGPNRRMLSWAWKIVERDDLISKAIEARKAEQSEEEAKAAAAYAEHRKRYYGPNSYDALKTIAFLIDNGRPLVLSDIRRIISEAITKAETGKTEPF